VEYNSAGAVVARNLYGKGIDEILMRIDATLGTFYYQDDHEGSVTHLTNSTGSVVESYTYDVFGAPTIFDSSHVPRPSSQYNNRFMFTGREYTSTFGIYEYRARAYHPGLGRFTGEDPKGFDAGDYNLFRYCHNDPEDLTDPMGTAYWMSPGGNTVYFPLSFESADPRKPVSQQFVSKFLDGINSVHQQGLTFHAYLSKWNPNGNVVQMVPGDKPAVGSGDRTKFNFSS